MADCRNEFLVQINGWRGDFCGTLLTPINRPGTRGSLARSGWEWEILTSTFPIVMDHAARAAQQIRNIFSKLLLQNDCNRGQ